MVKMELLSWIDIQLLNWTWLSRNPNAIMLLEENIDKIDWYWLSLNPNAISLLEENIDKINWHCLSENPNAIGLLEQNMNKINWMYKHPNFDLNEASREFKRAKRLLNL